MECVFGHNNLGCNCNNCPCKKEAQLGAIIKYMPEITYNTNRIYPTGKKAPDGIEIRFGSVRPTEQIREMLKAHGFKFSEKQTIWYAFDNAKSREMAAYFENNEVDADDTQYEKRYLWAKVGSTKFYNTLKNYTEFMLKTAPPRFFRTKKQLESALSNPASYIYNDMLRFKKFYNKIIGEDGEEEGGEGTKEETEEETEETEEEETEEESEEGEESERAPNPTNSVNLALSEKLENLADAMKKQIEAKLNSATSKQRPTPKRLRVAAGMREEGYYLRNIQQVLYGLSKVYKTGAIIDYPFLERIRTKSHIELINKIHDVHIRRREDHYIKSVFENNRQSFLQLGISSIDEWSKAVAQKEDLIFNIKTSASFQQTEKEEKFKKMEMEIRGMKIPGFFPTPKSLAERLVEIADLKENDAILEPSAGKGDILDAIKEHFGSKLPDLDAIELNGTLRDYLTQKGYNVIAYDFLDFEEQAYDKILMNPPFENGQDIDHVIHALDRLKFGGRVVAIMSEGVFFRQFKKETAFRELLTEKNAYVSEPIKGAFKDAFNQTGINVRIVAINEDGTYPEILDEEETDEDESKENDDETETKGSDEETELLELEAQAEIELLKLQVELERKKRKALKGLEGSVESKAEKLDRLKQMAKDLPLLPDAWDFK